MTNIGSRISTLAVITLLAGACSVPQETPAGNGTTTNNTFVLSNSIDMDGDGVADLGLPGGDVSVVISETCSQAPDQSTEEQCLGHLQAALTGIGDCDFIISDDPQVCFDGGLDCSLEKYSACAPCIHPGATEVNDGVDNDCDGKLGQNECATVADCSDDGDACTTDVCGDDNLCVTEAVTCDDGNACTTNTCNPASGCETEVVAGCCEVNEDCDGDEICGEDGTCEPVPCQDDNASDCLVVIAQAHSCQIVNAADGTLCNDGDACTTDEFCTTGTCGNGTSLTCDDGDACTTDSCDPATGCATEAVTCDDGNACTTNSCDPATGCTTEVITNCCAVNEDCAGDEVCDAGSCEPVPCQDDNASDCLVVIAQAHSCQIVNAADGTLCNDGDACTNGSTCTAGACGGGIAKSCDDGDACTADGCHWETGCTNKPVTCDDGNSCTTDSCNPATGCAYEPVLGCDADCNPQNDRNELGEPDEDNGDCASYRPAETDLPDAMYGWGCIPSGLNFSGTVGNCGAYEDEDGDENADGWEQICGDGIDGDLNGVLDDGPVCAPTCTENSCDDGDACTTDACVDDACVFTEIANCCEVDNDCSDDDACTTDACVDGLCANDVIEGCCEVDGDCSDGEICGDADLCVDDPDLDPCGGACNPATQICEAGLCIANNQGLICWDDTLPGESTATCHNYSSVLHTYWSPPLWWWANAPDAAPACGSTNGAPPKVVTAKCCVTAVPITAGWQCTGNAFDPYAL